MRVYVGSMLSDETTVRLYSVDTRTAHSDNEDAMFYEDASTDDHQAETTSHAYET